MMVEGSATDAAKALLVVDDNEIVREGLGNVLRREGYTVVLAASGREALEHLQIQPCPDLILLDI
jgi:CheY-like chemotaxis protein